MSKLRCWPGALAIVTNECSRKELRGKIITCDQLVSASDLGADVRLGVSGPEWTYTGERLHAYVIEFGRVMELYSIEDKVLQPLTPRPDPAAKERDEPIIKLEPEETTA